MTVEAAFDEIAEPIRVAHEDPALPWLACKKWLFGTRSQNRREIAGARGDSEKDTI